MSTNAISRTSSQLPAASTVGIDPAKESIKIKEPATLSMSSIPADGNHDEVTQPKKTIDLTYKEVLLYKKQALLQGLGERFSGPRNALNAMMSDNPDLPKLNAVKKGTGTALATVGTLLFFTASQVLEKAAPRVTTLLGKLSDTIADHAVSNDWVAKNIQEEHPGIEVNIEKKPSLLKVGNDFLNTKLEQLSANDRRS